MKDQGVIRAFKCPWSKNYSLLRLFKVDMHGEETLVATSSPVTEVAAAALARLSESVVPLRFDIDALANVLQLPGRTAWTSFTALEPSIAALKACLQHDMSRARGVVVIVTLSLSSNIVSDVRSVLEVVYPQLAPGAEAAFVTTFDASMPEEVRVEILLMGL